MAAIPLRRLRRQVRLFAALTIATTGLWLTAAAPTFACSCAMPGPMAEFDTANNAVFSGTAGLLDARGVPVRVETWFAGPNPAPLVYLAATSFGDGASCGINPPLAGSRWIWVAWVPEGGGDPSTGLCSPHAAIGSAEGDAMLRDAIATFGGVAPPGASTDPPEATPPPQVPADAGGLILAGTLGLGAIVLVGAGLLARRRPTPIR
jgi:hypothetical protein